MTSNLPPYPRFGESIRAFANALDITKPGDDLGRLAREGDFDWEKLDSSFNEILEAIQKICGRSVGHILQLWLSDLRTSYTRLILDVSLDALDRSQTLPIIINVFLPPHLASLLKTIDQQLRGPNLGRMLNPESRSVDVTLEWLDMKLNKPIEELLFPKSTDSDRVEREKLRKWRKGINLPSSQSIILLRKALEKCSLSTIESDVAALWLLLATALTRLEQSAGQSIRPSIQQCLQAQHFQHDASTALADKVLTFADSRPELRHLGVKVWHDLLRSAPKPTGSQARIWGEITQLQGLAKRLDPEGRTSYHYEWMKARWYVLSGQYQEALPHYKQAFELASYRAGHQIKSIIEEAACIAGLLEKRPFLKQLKHVGVAMGLFAKNTHKDLIEPWEFEQFASQLQYLFPGVGRFYETAHDLSESRLLGFTTFSQVKIGSLKPDLKNPDRVRAIEAEDGSVYRWPQLRFFTATGDFAAVQALLTAGANVNQLDDRGTSALQVALRYTAQTGDRKILDSILKHPHSKMVLNSPTSRQRRTPLYRAIELSLPDVVQSLLFQGADADIRCLANEQTALYYAISLLSRTHNPQKMRDQLLERLMQNPDLVQQEVLRREGIDVAGIYGSNKTLFQQNPALAKFAIEIFAKSESEPGRKPQLLEIVHLLLASGADPNASHKYPVPGRTPLMLAAENDFHEVFALMVEQYGGIPMQTDATGHSSHDIAGAFKAKNVQAYLQRNS
ncbi:MAG TPA: hypothetical protein DEO64_09300 [Alcaligenes faecalis]|nr:hypothetical protein [Alcaligenes faecalis]